MYRVGQSYCATKAVSNFGGASLKQTGGNSRLDRNCSEGPFCLQKAKMFRYNLFETAI